MSQSSYADKVRNSSDPLEKKNIIAAKMRQYADMCTRKDYFRKRVCYAFAEPFVNERSMKTSHDIVQGVGTANIDDIRLVRFIEQALGKTNLEDIILVGFNDDKYADDLRARLKHVEIESTKFVDAVTTVAFRIDSPDIEKKIDQLLTRTIGQLAVGYVKTHTEGMNMGEKISGYRSAIEALKQELIKETQNTKSAHLPGR